jgi:uncharacterized protein YbjT (DUF2867 family)
MNVLVCGARGFVGRAVCAVLWDRGHRVVEGVSDASAGRAPIAVDFVRDRDPAAWLPRLRGIDAVVNAVGLLRGGARRPLEAVHELVPGALFEACARAGVRRVVQVSALGIDDSPTDYARTKLAAERRLEALTRAGRLDGVVVRPSVVFGRGGASSALFIALSRLPALVLPRGACRTAIQPVAVDELAQVIATLVDGPIPARRIDAVGAAPVALAGFIASLRVQGGRKPARVRTLPDALARWSARLGDRLPGVTWCSTTLALLQRDNVGDPAPFAALLGRPPTRFDQLLGTVRA